MSFSESQRAERETNCTIRVNSIFKTMQLSTKDVCFKNNIDKYHLCESNLHENFYFSMIPDKIISTATFNKQLLKIFIFKHKCIFMLMNI